MKYKLGSLVEQVDIRNIDEYYKLSSVRGISIQKKFIDTKANMDNVSLKPYKIVKPNMFAYVTITSRNGDKITLAYNGGKDTYLVSSSYIVFRVKQPLILSSEYLFMYFNRPEFDRYSRFNSWGSVREAFSWDEMCDIELDLPPIEIQEKYVSVYKSMIENQKAYETGLEDLKLVYESTIERLKGELPNERLLGKIEQNSLFNQGRLGQAHVVGISTAKEFIETKAKLDGVSLKSYKVVSPSDFAYVPDTSRRGDKISIALNTSSMEYLVSSISTVFRVVDVNTLLPEFLFMFLRRSEFDRLARFNSWGSARETYDWDDLCQFKIPIPVIDKQQAIVNIYKSYITRKEINERLKQQIKDICPILIAGAIKEAKGNDEI